MQAARRAGWIASATLAAACGGGAPAAEGDAAPAGDAAAGTAGACLGTVDGMAHISGGVATVGRPAGDASCNAAPPPRQWWRALPATRVEAADFAIDLVEVSSGELQAWADAEGVFVGDMPGPADLPARNIPREVAASYCESLGKRLPRWYEWALAAQGSNMRRYPWGDQDPSCATARHEGCGDGPAPVGGRGLSPCGVSDLAGNVGEYLAPGDELPHFGDNSGYFFPGGGYLTPADGLCAFVYRSDEDLPHLGSPDVGFRCAMDL